MYSIDYLFSALTSDFQGVVNGVSYQAQQQADNDLWKSFDLLLLNMGFHTRKLMDFLLDFSFYYPLFMAYLWMLGALIYYFHWEKNRLYTPGHAPVLDSYPGVSVIVPCHNEGEDVQETVEYLLRQNYPDYEIIAVNDGSTDETLRILLDLAAQHPRIRVINLEQNQGKGMALNTGALFAKHEFLICIDGDALLAENAITWIMRHFISGPRVAAVTGNPR
ncbi:MAG: glycosyltransferase, partial [Methylomonas sp.]